MKELGKISEHSTSVPIFPVQEVAQQETNAQNAVNTGDVNASSSGRGNGRGKKSFTRQTGESDSYVISIAPLNIYENQVIPIGLHNLSKSLGKICPQFELYR